MPPSPQEHQMEDHLTPRAAASSLILCWIGDTFCCIRTVSLACVHLCLQQLKRCVRTLSGRSVRARVRACGGQWTCCWENSCQGSGVSDDGRAFLSVCVCAHVMVVGVCVWGLENCVLMTCLLGAPGHVCTVHVCLAPPVWQSVRKAL